MNKSHVFLYITKCLHKNSILKSTVEPSKLWEYNNFSSFSVLFSFFSSNPYIEFCKYLNYSYYFLSTYRPTINEENLNKIIIYFYKTIFNWASSHDNFVLFWIERWVIEKTSPHLDWVLDVPFFVIGEDVKTNKPMYVKRIHRLLDPSFENPKERFSLEKLENEIEGTKEVMDGKDYKNLRKAFARVSNKKEKLAECTENEKSITAFLNDIEEDEIRKMLGEIQKVYLSID